MKNIYLLLCAFLFVSSANALAEDGRLVSGIVNLSYELIDEVENHDYSVEKLRETKKKLKRILQNLREDDSVDDTLNLCRDYTFKVYSADGYNNSSSLKKAKEYCVVNHLYFSDMELFNYIYSSYKADGYNGTSSLNKAAKLFGEYHAALKNRYQDFVFFVGLYKSDGYNFTSSFNKTVQVLQATSRSSMKCVKKYVPVFREDGYNNTSSIRKAVEYCSDSL